MAVIVLPSPAPGLDTAMTLKIGRPVELLDDMAQRAVLLGLEGGGRHKAHEMLVHRRPAASVARRWSRRELDPREDSAGGASAKRGHAPARASLPEGPVPLGLLERLEELAHSGSSARAERARSESDEATGSMVRQNMAGCAR